MGYQFVTQRYDPIPRDNLNGWIVCAACGRRQRLPHTGEVLREYQAEGLVQIEERVIDTRFVVARSDANFLKVMAAWIPAIVGSLVMREYYHASIMVPVATLTIGASLLYLIAARHQLTWGQPAPEPAPTQPLPDVAEVEEHGTIVNSQSIFRFHKDAIRYKSGEAVPDVELWKIAQAWKSGTPFSRQMYEKGERKCTSQPAFMALRDAFVLAGIASKSGQGSEVELRPRARVVLDQWANAPRPQVEL